MTSSVCDRATNAFGLALRKCVKLERLINRALKLNCPLPSGADKLANFVKTLMVVIAVLFVLLPIKQASRAGTSSSADSKIPAFRHQWQNRDGQVVDVEIFAKGIGSYAINFVKEGKIVKTISVPPSDLGSYPESLFTLDDGNLASLWNTGGPYIILNVFADENGKVSRVLRTASKMPPEFVYRTSAAAGMSGSDNTMSNQMIIISKMQWVAHKGQGSKLEPVKADVYWWDQASRRYRSKVVQWKARLKN
jgi:hypothetical protein